MIIEKKDGMLILSQAGQLEKAVATIRNKMGIDPGETAREPALKSMLDKLQLNDTAFLNTQRQHDHRQDVMRIAWLARTRPDIKRAISCLASRMKRSTEYDHDITRSSNI